MGICSISVISHLTLVTTKKKVVSLQVSVFSFTSFKRHLITESGNVL